ncbi:MAG: two-component system, OmpR family, sensor histidine kinase KdpD, partial [Solirubrobacteraceae bacterium]|nr:two-component system, OmpR family, sensor histidine kinase KdpD [Solirubrobacteraceae bacterium]
SVVYLVAVLLASTYWGLGLGIATSLLSALAFNFFHLPPTGRFLIADSRNLVALGAFLTVAAATSRIADVARLRALEAEARRRDADLAAGLTRLLLGSESLPDAVPLAAHRIAAALEIPAVALEFGVVEPGERRIALPLRDGERTLATLLAPAHLPALTERRLRESVVPSLETILRAAVEREALQAGVVATEALRQSDELKTALLRAVSHDLRTPLTAIHAAGHALSDDDVRPGEREELAAGIVAESARLAALVEKLLDLSRLQGGSTLARAGECSPDEPLLVAIEAVGGDVRLAIDDPLPAVHADPAQLERAFANLVENAVRHSDGHPVQVRARAVGPRVITRIIDRGPGIPAAEQARIFEPFYRGAGENHGGAGLGLAIAKGLIEANGGTLGVESFAGQGTTFVVTLPVAETASG